MDNALELLEERYNLAIENLSSVTIDSDYAYERTLVGLYCSILEYSRSLITLFRGNSFISIKPIFRCLLEASVDLSNLSNDKKYGYRLEANYDKEWLKILASAEEGNPFLKSILEDESYGASLTKTKENLSLLRLEGYNPIKITEKFRLSNMSNEYESLYNFLCAESHNNIRALIGRHFKINNEKLEIHLIQDTKGEDCELYLEEASRILIITSNQINKALNQPDDKLIQLEESL